MAPGWLGVVMSQWEGRVKKGRKDPKFGMRCMELGVSKNNGTPKSSILIGFSIINHPIWGTPISWKHPIDGNGMVLVL